MLICTWQISIYVRDFFRFSSISSEGRGASRTVFVSGYWEDNYENSVYMKWSGVPALARGFIPLCVDFIRRLTAARMNAHARTPTSGSPSRLTSRLPDRRIDVSYRRSAPVDRTVTNTRGFYIPLRSSLSRASSR